MTFLSKVKIAAFGAVAVSSSLALAQSDWKDRISISGDMRFRLQRDISAQNISTTGTTDNMKPRLRARLNFVGRVNDALTANFMIGTGDLGGTGSRTNHVTLSPVSDIRPFNLILGYLEYKATDSLNLQIGKAPNLFWSGGNTYMVWSPDIRFEGVQGKWMGDMGNLKPYLVLTYANMLDRIDNLPSSPSSGAPDSLANGPDIAMFGAQLGTKWSMDPLDLNFAISSFNYNNMKNLATSNGATINPFCTSATSCYGNTVDATGGNHLKYDYKLLHAAFEIGYKLGFAPAAFFVDYIQNTDPSENNKGMLAGLTLGSLKDTGSWLMRYTYRDLAKDAAVGIFAEPTYLGGSTDLIGSDVALGYMAWKNTSLVFTWYSGRKNVSTTPYDAETYVLDLTSTF